MYCKTVQRCMHVVGKSRWRKVGGGTGRAHAHLRASRGRLFTIMDCQQLQNMQNEMYADCQSHISDPPFQEPRKKLADVRVSRVAGVGVKGEGW